MGQCFIARDMGRFRIHVGLNLSWDSFTSSYGVIFEQQSPDLAVLPGTPHLKRESGAVVHPTCSGLASTASSIHAALIEFSHVDDLK